MQDSGGMVQSHPLPHAHLDAFRDLWYLRLLNLTSDSTKIKLFFTVNTEFAEIHESGL